jgi:hypothetical protein
MLFSREFLQAARSQLAPGGVFAQWFHGYETDDETIALVLRTYASVFERVSVWYTMTDDLLLLGFADADAEVDLDRVASRAAMFDYRAGLSRAGVSGVPALLAHELVPLGVLHAPEPGTPIHTLLHPILSHHAARAFFRGGEAQLRVASPPETRSGGASMLLQRWAARRGSPLTEQERGQAAHEICAQRRIECAQMIAQWQLVDPSAGALARQLARARLIHPNEPALSDDGLAELRRAIAARALTDARPLPGAATAAAAP